MFLRKKPNRKRGMTLILMDASMQELSSCPLCDYVLPEETVLSLSKEYFNDPEPCEIHRGAVHNRVMMELTDLCTPGDARKISDFPDYTRLWFPGEAAFVLITE